MYFIGGILGYIDVDNDSIVGLSFGGFIMEFLRVRKNLRGFFGK